MQNTGWNTLKSKTGMLTGAIIAVVCATVLALGTYTLAHAESLEELAQKVEETSAAYNDAVAEQERLAAEIKSATAQIAEIEAALPEKQEKAANVIAGMYRAGTSPELDVLNAILGAKSFSDAIRFYEDYNKILDYTSGVVSDAVNAKHDLEDTKAKLTVACFCNSSVERV